MAPVKKLTVEREPHSDQHAVVYRLKGKLIGTPECYEFLEALREDVRGGRRRVVLNLSELERVTSPGIGIIAASYTSLRKEGGCLVLAEAPEHVRTLMQLVGLWDLLEKCASETDALDPSGEA